MAKGFRCEDLGFRWDAVAKGETEAELLAAVAQHAAGAHGINEVTEEIAARARAVMREE